MKPLIVNFNHDHYMKVWRARKNAGLPLFSDIFPNNGEIPNHSLIDAILESKSKTYHVQSVHRHWHRGWYIILLCYSWYKSNETMGVKFEDGQWWGKSHVTLFWENESCVENIILKSIKRNKKVYTVKI